MSIAIEIVILGTGGNCLDIYDTLLDCNDHAGRELYRCAGYLDDRAELWGKALPGGKVLGPLTEATNFPDAQLVNGIGSPANFQKKSEIVARTGLPLERFAQVIHPTASVSRTAHLGRGVVVFQHVTVTTNVDIGNHVMILPNSVISHDTVVGSWSTLTGGVCVSGQVRIGESSYLGTGCVIRNGVSVGSGVMVGMGAVVTRDVADSQVVAGNPARVIGSVA